MAAHHVCRAGHRVFFTVSKIFTHILQSWWNALLLCKSLGGGAEMAKVRNGRQNEVLAAMSEKLGREDIWIGGQDLVVEGKEEKGTKPPLS